MNYLNTFDVLHKFQNGFRSGHSTKTALTLMTERWLKADNDGNIVGTIMIDFRNAFDLVDHDLLTPFKAFPNLKPFRIKIILKRILLKDETKNI